MHLPLTNRETEVLQLIAFEYTTKEIAEKLFISFETASTHRKNLIKKLSVRNLAGLVRVGIECGLIQLKSSAPHLEHAA